MPTIYDVVEIAKSLKEVSVVPAEKRCVVVRNRNANCRLCKDVCPVDAITVKFNRLRVNNDTCTGCQACTSVCPTEALVPIHPNDFELATLCAGATLVTGGVTIIACARMAAKNLAYEETYATVPCLCRLDESLLVNLAAHGVDRIVLVSGNCWNCKHGESRNVTMEAVDAANEILECMHSNVFVELQEGFPEEVLLGDEREVRAHARRNFFSSSGGLAKEAGEKTVMHMLNIRENYQTKGLLEALKLGSDGAQAIVDAIRHDTLVDAMSVLAIEAAATETAATEAAVAESAAEASAAQSSASASPSASLAAAEFGSGEREDDEDLASQALEQSSIPPRATGEDASLSASDASDETSEAEGRENPFAYTIEIPDVEVPDEIDVSAVEPELFSRRFGNVVIDPDLCVGCALCTVFCPTHALAKAVQVEPEIENGIVLAFSAGDCVQCNVCADVCQKEALTVEPFVEVADIFSYDPRYIHLSRKSANKPMGSRNR